MSSDLHKNYSYITHLWFSRDEKWCFRLVKTSDKITPIRHINFAVLHECHRQLRHFLDDIYTPMLDNGQRGDKVHGKSSEWLTNELRRRSKGVSRNLPSPKVGKIAWRA